MDRSLLQVCDGDEEARDSLFVESMSRPSLFSTLVSPVQHVCHDTDWGARRNGKMTTDGGLDTRGHHLGCHDIAIEGPYSRLAKCSLYRLFGECADMDSPIDEQEILLRHSLFLCAGPLLFLLRPIQLERPENNVIEALIDMCSMGGITDDMDPVFPCEIEEWLAIVGIVAIDGDYASPPRCLRLRLIIKILHPLQVNLAVDPAFLGVSEATIN
ncbi:hypothetical protein C8R45DRAFT_296766 [Mycena sanguinolenta]|nr:hypothetical protein C8R45DRAFT_296766 [Mycena sanguinolenta]